MADPILVKYIKDNLGAGFAESEIWTALKSVGWSEAEIEEGFLQGKGALSGAASVQNTLVDDGRLGFFVRHRKLLIIILVMLIVLPLLGWGGPWAYQKYVKPEAPDQDNNTVTRPDESVQGILVRDQSDEVLRDHERLGHIRELQVALEIFHSTHEFYPQALSELLGTSSLSKIPVDPATQKFYLYTPFGDPPLYYTLSFILEGDVGTLEHGLQVVTSESILPLETIEKQDALLRNKQTLMPSEALKITDFSQASFYSGQEVVLTVTGPVGVALDQVHLIAGDLHLVAKTWPFGFSFSAPEAPGDYAVNVFAFDKLGQSYFQKTTLAVKNGT